MSLPIDATCMVCYLKKHLDLARSLGDDDTVNAFMREHQITSCAYIGDTQGDRNACLEANVPFIYAAYGLGSADGWDVQIDTFEELRNL